MRSTLSLIGKTLSGLTEVKGSLATLVLRPLTSVRPESFLLAGRAVQPMGTFNCR